MSSVDVKPTGVLELFCDQPNLTWDHVNNIRSRPLTSITKGPQYAVTGQFVSSIQANKNFSHCLSPYCFLDQIVTSCMGFLKNGPWFTCAHTEIGGGASFASLNKGIKIWCASTSSTGTSLFERCCHSPERFIELMLRGPRECEARYLQSTIQRPGDLIYIPHLLAHAVLTLDRGSPTNLSGWDAATTPNQNFIPQTLDEYTFGVRRGKWREIFREKVFQHYANGSFLILQVPRKVRTGFKNTGIIGNSTLLIYYHPYTLKKWFPVKFEVIASPLYSRLSYVIRVRTLLARAFFLNNNYSSVLISALQPLRVGVHITLAVIHHQ